MGLTSSTTAAEEFHEALKSRAAHECFLQDENCRKFAARRFIEAQDPRQPRLEIDELASSRASQVLDFFGVPKSQHRHMFESHLPFVQDRIKEWITFCTHKSKWLGHDERYIELRYYIIPYKKSKISQPLDEWDIGAKKAEEESNECLRVLKEMRSLETSDPMRTRAGAEARRERAALKEIEKKRYQQNLSTRLKEEQETTSTNTNNAKVATSTPKTMRVVAKGILLDEDRKHVNMIDWFASPDPAAAKSRVMRR